MQLFEFAGKYIEITDIDGAVFVGKAWNYTSSPDNDDGEETICIGCIEFLKSEIQSIKIVGDNYWNDKATYPTIQNGG